MEQPKRTYNKIKREGAISKRSTSDPSSTSYRLPNRRHAPGEIYIIVACGYHGIFPGCFLHRCKIGLAMDARIRLKRLQSIQAPCHYKLLKVIKVRDMAVVETLLHKQFSSSNVQLNQSREWFDLTFWQIWDACRAFRHFENHPRFGTKRIPRFPFAAIALSIAGILIAATIIQIPNISQKPPQSVDHKIKAGANTF